ncbi:Gfo/Idh/MocA family oxidoreductase [Streptomyces sp. NP160]|uniref:Gfo/Idh/MocA family protein n=1 Tax=Streptomyces sp. NP160 TaxID=2586637 RepID=UPI00111B83FB|nr:Gfo/Idh/MocA family oxidoreductase [Streptomyces sp. NP160]TNM61966.1 Gfo/Idh/MocA family oxidoreductase [Streptomyces sp. NP160]
MTEELSDLRVAVVGVGMMGADHVRRLQTRTAGARAVVVADAFPATAEKVAATWPGVRVAADPLSAIADEEVDAVVIATPGNTHEELVTACLERGRPVLCEKPLTTDVESSLRLVEAERATGRRLVQVGFMRRFDPEYAALRRLVESDDLGRPLMLHCAHRNASVPPHFTSEMVVLDSLVHEVDCTRFLLGEEITAITVIHPRSRHDVPDGLSDPTFALLETESGALVDVEVNVATGLGYEVRTELVAERGTAMIGLEGGPVVARGGAGSASRGRAVPPSFKERFEAAYDLEFQAWADAARRGTATGPTAWDGYAATAVTTAGVEALRSGRRTEVVLERRA